MVSDMNVDHVQDSEKEQAKRAARPSQREKSVSRNMHADVEVHLRCSLPCPTRKWLAFFHTRAVIHRGSWSPSSRNNSHLDSQSQPRSRRRSPSVHPCVVPSSGASGVNGRDKKIHTPSCTHGMIAAGTADAGQISGNGKGTIDKGREKGGRGLKRG